MQCVVCSVEFTPRPNHATRQKRCSVCTRSREGRRLETATAEQKVLANERNRRYYARLSPERKAAKIVTDNAAAKAKGWPTAARYRLAHPDEVRERTNAWLRSADGKAWRKQWKVANPGIVRSMKVRRYAIERGAEADRIDVLALYARDEGCCGICGRPVEFDDASVDHIIPISRGGAHKWDNVQTAHLMCNVRKGSKVPV